MAPSTNYNYPEIEALSALHFASGIAIEKQSGCLCKKSNYPEVRVKIDSQQWTLFLFDEFKDLNHPNALLHLELLLMEIEMYVDSEDFLSWCKELGVDAGCAQAINYYRELDQVAFDLGTRLQRSEGLLCPMDFELNAGAAQYLRNTPFPVSNE